MTALSPQSGLGVYVHFPWCLKKCPYCDFLSVAVPSKTGLPLTATEARSAIPHRIYADGVIAELRARLDHLPRPLPLLRSVFFGGGTPSLWDPKELGRVLAAIRDALPAAAEDDDLEVTVECNPTSFDENHARALLEVGVNRTSLGVQGLDEERLQFLGRLHDSQGGLRAVRAALAAGVPRVSADLIYGIYKQDPGAAVSDVRRVLDVGPSHLSAYALTIEAGTRFGALSAQGKLPLLEEEQVAASFHAVSEAARDAGFRHYEISNFARPGHESRHNLGYWQGRDYLGLGTGAYGTVTLDSGRLRYRNSLSPERYMNTWGKGSGPSEPFVDELSDREEIPPAVSHQEALLLGLRTEQGVSLAEVAELRGADPNAEARQPVLERLFAGGRLVEEDGRLRIPRAHWLFADGIVRELL